MYPFYEYKDNEYQEFIIDLIQELEPRYFAPWTVIYQELDECLEMYFVLKGTFDVGYELNKKATYRLRIGSKHVIGAFNMQF